MAKKAVLKRSKSTLISQLLIGATIIIILIAAYEAVTQKDIVALAPTQLFLVAAVFGILGLYLKDEK